jgi:hypothetical protein
LPTVWTQVCICTMQMNKLSVKMLIAERLEIKHTAEYYTNTCVEKAGYAFGMRKAARVASLIPDA